MEKDTTLMIKIGVKLATTNAKFVTVSQMLARHVMWKMVITGILQHCLMEVQLQHV